MTDDTQAQNEVKETPQEAMPTSNEKTATPVEATPVADASQVNEQANADAGLELPEDAKERTRQQFDKLKNDLAAERQRRVQLERVFSPQATQQTQPQGDWYNPLTGEVDDEKRRQERQATQAEIAQLKTQLQGVSRINEAQQEKEAYAAYPDLDPSRKEYDDSFQKQVVSYLATSFAEGKSPTLKDAADSVMGLAKKVAQKARQEGATEALEQLTPKEQASLEATGRSDRRTPRVDWDSVRATTRRGGRDGITAAMQRIARIQPVGK